VADAARLILVAEDTLGTLLDFTSAINVPNEASGKPFKIDWDKVSWSAGFDLNLALDRLNERNAYRRALIAFDAAVRAREEAEDQLRADIRDTMRTLRSLEKSFVIGQASVVNAKRRVDRTEMFVLAGGRERTETRDVLEAKEALIRSQLSLTDVLVDFAVAKLQLLQDLDALPLEPKGLRYDPGLPLPVETQRTPASPTSKKAEETPR
jgi:outer membrane protein TolC